MKKSILFSVFAFCATVLQAQTIATGTISQNCDENGLTVDLRAPSSTSPNGHEYVDLGLSVKWATCNVGAESPEDYGDYFAWGETAAKQSYSSSTYFDENESGQNIKYKLEGGKTVLDMADDAAHVIWGGGWRIPSETEWKELINNCTWEWVTQNRHNGYKVTSNKAGYTDNSIFLPAAGSRSGSSYNSLGFGGSYWTYSLGSESAWALYLDFSSDGSHLINQGNRCLGRSVRAVLP